MIAGCLRGKREEGERGGQGKMKKGRERERELNQQEVR
jgi:hypothetical protein